MFVFYHTNKTNTNTRSDSMLIFIFMTIYTNRNPVSTCFCPSTLFQLLLLLRTGSLKTKTGEAPEMEVLLKSTSRFLTAEQQHFRTLKRDVSQFETLQFFLPFSDVFIICSRNQKVLLYLFPFNLRFCSTSIESRSH